MGKREIAGAAITLAVCSALVMDCNPAARTTAVTHATQTEEKPRAEAVVLVTIDGVRWQEIFRGVDHALAEGAKLPPAPDPTSRALLPNLHRLFFDGGIALGDPSVGGGIEGSAPWHVSMPGYVEIATGASTDCENNDCHPPLGETIADAVSAAPGDHGAAVFGSWSEIARAAGAHPERLFLQTGGAPGHAGRSLGGGATYLSDDVTATEALAYLQKNRPRFLWVALGDTDEWAHAGAYGNYLEALRAADRFVGDLAATLARMGERGARTAIFVTADHGRDPDFRDHGGPPSGPVWLLARGPTIAPRGVIATSRRRQLRDVTPTMRALLGLPLRACKRCGEPIEEIVALR